MPVFIWAFVGSLTFQIFSAFTRYYEQHKDVAMLISHIQNTSISKDKKTLHIEYNNGNYTKIKTVDMPDTNVERQYIIDKLNEINVSKINEDYSIIMDAENIKIIKTRIENIFIFEDRYVFSKANNISELNSEPDRYTKLALIILCIMGAMPVIVIFTICMYLQRDFNFFNIDRTAAIILFVGVGFIFIAFFVNRYSRKSVVYKKDIIRIYIDEKSNCLFFRFKEGRKRARIRRVILPSYVNEKEKMEILDCFVASLLPMTDTW
jgi:hypothetical protein